MSLDIKFYPVLQLMTGPPPLTRNGGIWKGIKKNLRQIQTQPRLMVQPLHFTNYDLNKDTFDKWLIETDNESRIKTEIISTMGKNCDVFLDSGGFQLLNTKNMNLSRWGMTFSREDIFQLQLKYNPNSVASLDSPITPKDELDTVKKSFEYSINNAKWLYDSIDSINKDTRGYLVIHGRNVDEISHYLKKLSNQIRSFDKNKNFGFALGSQVPLTNSQITIKDNVKGVISWMNSNGLSEMPLHIFGVGENVIGMLKKECDKSVYLSFDNSSYVQKSYLQYYYDYKISKYIHYNPYSEIGCDCYACNKLSEIGPEIISKILSNGSYKYIQWKDLKLYKSDIFSLLALHNLAYWEDRVNKPRSLREKHIPINTENQVCKAYKFPYVGFKRNGKNLILLPCTKSRPYSKSRTHRNVIIKLEKEGFFESIDYDRMTLSGLNGIVHWADENKPIIMNYDFKLNDLVAPSHINQIIVKTATVLGVISKHYENKYALIKQKTYRNTFCDVLQSHGVQVFSNVEDLLNELHNQ